MQVLPTFKYRGLKRKTGRVCWVQEEAQAPQGGAEGQAGDQLQHSPDQAQALQQVNIFHILSRMPNFRP